MLKLATPVSPDYIAPISGPIAYVDVGVLQYVRSRSFIRPQFTLLNANMQPIPYVSSGLPQPGGQPTATQVAAILAAVTSATGQTLDQVISAACLNTVAAIFGLTGLSVQ
jgi:hypothetical protein